jgi:hypothetical protein
MLTFPVDQPEWLESEEASAEVQHKSGLLSKKVMEAAKHGDVLIW